MNLRRSNVIKTEAKLKDAHEIPGASFNCVRQFDIHECDDLPHCPELAEGSGCFHFFIRGFNQFAETAAAGGTMTSAGGMLDFSAFGGVGAMSAPVILCAVTSL